MPIGILLQNVLIPLGCFAMVVLFVWFSHVTRRKAQEQRAELLRQLIDKFSSGEALVQSVQGPEGAMLVQALSLESERPSTRKWIGLFIPASILSLIGLGFFVLYFVADQIFLIPAIVIGAVGAALALSTYVMRHVEERDRKERPRSAVDAVATGDARSQADVL